MMRRESQEKLNSFSWHKSCMFQSSQSHRKGIPVGRDFRDVEGLKGRVTLKLFFFWPKTEDV